MNSTCFSFWIGCSPGIHRQNLNRTRYMLFKSEWFYSIWVCVNDRSFDWILDRMLEICITTLSLLSLTAWKHTDTNANRFFLIPKREKNKWIIVDSITPDKFKLSDWRLYMRHWCVFHSIVSIWFHKTNLHRVKSNSSFFPSIRF